MVTDSSFTATAAASPPTAHRHRPPTAPPPPAAAHRHISATVLIRRREPTMTAAEHVVTIWWGWGGGVDDVLGGGVRGCQRRWPVVAGSLSGQQSAVLSTSGQRYSAIDRYSAAIAPSIAGFWWGKVSIALLASITPSSDSNTSLSFSTVSTDSADLRSLVTIYHASRKTATIVFGHKC